MTFSRRRFVKASVLGAVAAGVGAHADGKAIATNAVAQERDGESGPHKRPIIVCANNGYAYLENAFAFLKGSGGHSRRCAQSRQRP